MNGKLNASGTILPGALRLRHVLPLHHASTAMPMECSNQFTEIVLCLFRDSGVFDRVTTGTPFSMLTSILPTSAIHCDGDDLRQMPAKTGASTPMTSQ
jgi:hypothetical protein